MARKSLEERFWEKVALCGRGGCWEWLAGKQSQGYGTFSVDRGTVYSHRTSWNLCFGDIPEGLHVLHSCDNPSCVNPSHLFLGTHTDNMRDMALKGRNVIRANPNTPEVQARGETHGRVKLSEYSVLQIRALIGIMSQRAIARMFRISQSQVSNIQRGQHWTHI